MMNRDEQARQQVNETIPPVLASAIAAYEQYRAWQHAGFSKGEAFTLLRDALRIAYTNGHGGDR